jgi:hypothetical protein
MKKYINKISATTRSHTLSAWKSRSIDDAPMAVAEVAVP